MFRKKLARLVSAALNAPLVALVTFIPLIISQRGSSSLLLFIITTFFGTIMPLLWVSYMVWKGIISDFYASDRRMRVKPLIGAILSYLGGVAALTFLRAPKIVTALMACYLVNAFILLAITLIWKISIHVSGVTGPITALVYQLGSAMLLLFLIAIPVAWARLELKAHDIKQVIAGALLAAWLTWIQMDLYVNYLLI